MSTSSVWTVNRCARSFARSSTSPTSRSSRVVSLATTSSEAAIELGVVDQPVAERIDVALDRGQRRAKLVGDGHQELPLALLGRGQPRGHLVEPLGEVADLVAAATDGHVRRRSCPEAISSEARASARTGPLIRRDSQAPSSQASSPPMAIAAASRPTSGTHCSRTTSRGFATMIAPSAGAPGSRRSGCETARNVCRWPGGRNSKVTGLSAVDDLLGHGRLGQRA